LGWACYFFPKHLVRCTVGGDRQQQVHHTVGVQRTGSNSWYFHSHASAVQHEFTMRSALPVIQLELRPGIIELGWGHPPLHLLPTAEMGQAAVVALARHGGEALTYGHTTGPGPLLDWLRQRIGQQEGRTPAANEILITAGNSQAFDQILTLCTQPGDTVLVESPTYHLAVRILRDHPLNLVAVPVDQDGLIVEALQQTLADLWRDGVRPRLLYTIPTFHNPTSVCLSPARRQALVRLAAAADFVIVEDDVYRELAYDAPAPPSLWSLAPDRVIRMGSFAKSLAPGVRLGWLTGPAPLITRIADGGLLDSGGGINHFAALVVNELCHNGAYEAQITRLKQAYTTQRNALLTALGDFMPPGCRWYAPGGGFFAWLFLPEGLDTRQLLPHAEAGGVAYLPAATFCLDNRLPNALRLSFSLYGPEELTEGVRRLAQTVAAELARGA
jgi:2-aminoadipate transaminase